MIERYVIQIYLIIEQYHKYICIVHNLEHFSNQFRDTLMINDIYDDLQNTYRLENINDTSLINITNDILNYLYDPDYTQLFPLGLSSDLIV